jgi:polyisoprenoid-binding protein YceI/mono/diheme cytochrome c family protein
MGRMTAWLRRHPWRTALLSVGLLVVAGGAWASRDLIRLWLEPEQGVDLTVPAAAVLDPAAGQTVYRIDPTRSEVTVEVDERLAGAERTAVLSTKSVAGSMGVDPADPTSSRIGEMVVNVHALRSDNSLRDKAISHDHLESHDHPNVRLLDARIVDAPDGPVRDGEPVDVTIEGDLEVKGEREPVTFDATVGLDGDTLTATATATVLMSDYGIGPISKVGLVSTGDEVRLTLRLTAVDADRFTPPGLLTVTVADAGSDTADAPSFDDEVRPILEANCASCHQPGQIGAAHWELEDAEDASEVADGLAVVTRSGYMPPWPASDAGIPLQHVRELSEDQIATIAAWAEAGGPLDVEADSPVEAPDRAEVPLPRQDLSLPLPEPYSGESGHEDDYRCFLLDPGFTEPSHVTGYVFEADRLDVVHHALVYRNAGADRAKLEAADAADPGSGWSCAVGMGPGAGGALVAGWVPGQRPQDFGEGVGFRFEPGDVLVSQIHYHYEGARPTDNSVLHLEVAPPGADLIALQTRSLIGPVELPCPAGTTLPLCDRNVALDDVTARFGIGGRLTAEGLHRICRTTPEQLAALSDGTTARTTCDYKVRQQGDIVDVLGHMHELGATYRMTLNPGTPEEQVLLDIPTWDFAWQLNYQPVQPVAVDRDDTIRVECTWDRRVNPTAAMRYIVFAEGTEDEMCFSTITLRPRDP